MNDESSALERRLLEMQARLCQVLSNVTRLEILYTLHDGELTAGDLARSVQTTTANLSQHLSLMRQHGLVEARKEGLNVYYRLAAPEILTACGAVRKVLMKQMQRTQALLQAGGHELETEG